MAAYSFEWHGDKVLDDVLMGCLEALNRLSVEAEEAVREGAPVRTGFLRDSVYAFVDSTGGLGSRTPALILGAAAEYAMEVELGTRYMPARPFILNGALTIMPHIGPAIADVLGTRGYGGSATFGSAGPGLPNPYTGGHLGELLPAALAAGALDNP